MSMVRIRIGLLLVMSTMLTGCIRVEVATPDKPINIDMNVKIDHDIRITMDKNAEEVLKNDPDLLSLTASQTTHSVQTSNEPASTN